MRRFVFVIMQTYLALLLILFPSSATVNLQLSDFSWAYCHLPDVACFLARKTAEEGCYVERLGIRMS